MRILSVWTDGNHMVDLAALAKPIPEIKYAPRANVFPAPNNRGENSADATYVPLSPSDSASPVRMGRKRPRSQPMQCNHRSRFRSDESYRHIPESPTDDELDRQEIERPAPWYHIGATIPRKPPPTAKAKTISAPMDSYQNRLIHSRRLFR